MLISNHFTREEMFRMLLDNMNPQYHSCACNQLLFLKLEPMLVAIDVILHYNILPFGQYESPKKRKVKHIHYRFVDKE